MTDLERRIIEGSSTNEFDGRDYVDLDRVLEIVREAGLKWSKELPVEPGYYWRSSNPLNGVAYVTDIYLAADTPLEVLRAGAPFPPEWLVLRSDRRLSQLRGGPWLAGPIPKPEGVKS